MVQISSGEVVLSVKIEANIGTGCVLNTIIQLKPTQDL